MRTGTIVRALCIAALLVIAGCAGKNGIYTSPEGEQVAAAKTAGSPVAFSSVYVRRHTAHGMDVQITWKNITDRTVKQCFMETYLTDPDGNRVPDEIFRNDSKLLRFDASIAPNQTHWGSITVHADVLYQAAASTLHIGNVWVVYEDGKASKPVRVDMLPGTSAVIGSME